jgi:hypothetical protein
MKRFVAVLAACFAAVGTTAGTASASANKTNVGVQVASIHQTSLAKASATQFGGFFSSNTANAYSANFASIKQSLTQINF